MRTGLLRNGLLAAGAAAVLAAAGCAQDTVESDDNLVAGKQQFVQKCGSCHVLARAGTRGTVGPNLDDAFRQSLREGLGRTTVRGVVYEQILFPPTLEGRTTGTQMPAKLVEGQDAEDVAAYVASVAARAGEDAGLLAEAVKKAGGGEAATASNGVLEIDADPNGQLAYVTTTARAEAGALTLRSKNDSQVPHDIALEAEGGRRLGKGEVVQGGGVSEFETEVEAGEYTYYCTVEGHRPAGMEGTLTVR
jgi:mono/diheme cytochrome c family protein